MGRVIFLEIRNSCVFLSRMSTVCDRTCRAKFRNSFNVCENEALAPQVQRETDTPDEQNARESLSSFLVKIGMFHRNMHLLFVPVSHWARLVRHPWAQPWAQCCRWHWTLATQRFETVTH